MDANYLAAIVTILVGLITILGAIIALSKWLKANKPQNIISVVIVVLYFIIFIYAVFALGFVIRASGSWPDFECPASVP